jgi:hypothetical protein
VRRLSRKCGSLDGSQPYGPPWPVMGLALPSCVLYWTWTHSEEQVALRKPEQSPLDLAYVEDYALCTSESAKRAIWESGGGSDPSVHKRWHYISSTNGGSSVGIVRSRTKGHGVCF